MTQRILITGSTGFVGRQVLNVLQSQNSAISIVVRTGSEKKHI